MQRQALKLWSTGGSMKVRVAILLLLGFSFLCSGLYAQKTATSRRDAPIAKGLSIKCSGVDYAWTGMLRESQNNHSLETTKAVNSTPLDVVILEKADSLMVDNEKFKIIRSNASETFAIFLDERNAITVVLNYRYGSLLYSKVFTNVEVGKQNAMSFVATCKNY
jgi:hypothetical protein